LRVLRVGLGHFLLGKAQHSSGCRKLDRGTQASYARTHNDEVGFAR